MLIIKQKGAVKMAKTFSNRIIARIASFSAAAVVLAAAAGFGGYRLMTRYKNTIEGKYQMALNDFADYTTNIKTTLEKSLYANTSAQQQPSFAKLMSMCEGAKTALSQLPMSTGQAVSVQKYLAQVGDYSFYALSKIAKNNALTDDERETLKMLYKYAAELDLSVGDMAAAYADGSVTLGEPITLKGNIESMGESTELALDGGFREMNEGFADYPTMIYDGPFSDHISNRKSAFLKGQRDATQEQAETIAANFLKIDKSKLNYEGETKGNLPTYNFTTDNGYITVTKQGGYIDIYRSSEAVGNTTLSYDDALSEAKKRLSSIFNEDFTESYYSITDNVCTINLAYTKDNIIYYSDLVKVSVSLQTGEIMGYCATGYLMSHTQRDLKSPRISQATAQQSLSKALKVKSVKTALIPTSGLNEVLTYEFTCEADNETLLVYINCETAQEEQMYIVLKSDNGVLVM